MCYSGSTHYFAEVLIPREMNAKYFPGFTDVLLGYVSPHTLVGGGIHFLILRHHSPALCELRSKQCKLGFSTVPSMDTWIPRTLISTCKKEASFLCCVLTVLDMICRAGELLCKFVVYQSGLATFWNSYGQTTSSLRVKCYIFAVISISPCCACRSTG